MSQEAPLQLAPFTITFEDKDTPLVVENGYPTDGERIEASWSDPDQGGAITTESFYLDFHCLFNDVSLMSVVPDGQMEACLRMASILAPAIPGTNEYFDMVTNQDTKNFQTSAGNMKLKTNGVVRVDDEDLLPGETPARTYEITFQKVGSSNNTKVIRTDAWILSQYRQGVSRFAFAAQCIPGAIFKEFGSGYKQSTIDDTKRQAICDYINEKLFWV